MSLPSGYTRLEYIECTGTQCIDTGVTDVSSEVLEITMEIEWLSGTGYIFKTTADAASLGMYVKSATNIECTYMHDYQDITLTTVYGRYQVSKNSYTFTANGESTTFSSSGNSTSTNLYLLSSDSKTFKAASARIYSCKIEAMSVIYRDFIPCKNAQGVVGLWDDINLVFYGNSGTGAFVAGPEIEVSGSNKSKTLINGTSYEIKRGRVLIGGTGYSIKKGRTLIGGTGYDVSFTTPLGEVEEGTLVKLLENSVQVEFYVTVHDYQPDLNSRGRTLLVRKECWNSYAGKNFKNLSSAYLKLFDSDVQSLIATTKYYYTESWGDDEVSPNELAIFQLSVNELGLMSEDIDALVEGNTVPIANTLRIAYKNGAASKQGTRTMENNSNGSQGYYYRVNSDGSVINGNASVPTRPAFTLPSELEVDSDFNIIIP